MIGYLLTTLITALSLLIVDIIFPGVNIASFPVAILAGVAIGLVNSVIRPVLSFVSIPVNFLTLGLFSFVLNGVCFWLASALVPGFAVRGLLAFFLAPVVLSLGTTLLNNYFVSKGTLPGRTTSNPAIGSDANS
ncbi:phage holin family protein [Egbenema bharatensis]|uniref:phage holin family protein n=1 Tax=Egbenema bharatensis TaxID=3463334 RepID=UPI003A88505D